jgi:hypothetical protein
VALALAAFTGLLEGKEARPTPGRPGDGARNCRQAGISGSLPFEAVPEGRDGVTPALVLANQDGPEFELASWRAVLSRQALQEPQAIAIETAKNPLLQARGNHAAQQVLAQTTRGHASEHQPPLPPQCIGLEQTHALDLSRDCGRLSPAPHVRRSARQQ